MTSRSSMRRHLASAAVVVVLSAVPFAHLDAQQVSAVERRLDPATAAAVLSVADSARAIGLPVEPLYSKALEGASKRAAGARIVAAVRTLAGELSVARNALGAESTPAELEAAASALHVGARQADLARLRAVRSGQPLTVALAVLSDLVARGVPAPDATHAVLALADRRLRDADFVTFRREVERDIALGAPPAAATTVRLSAGARSGELTNSRNDPSIGGPPVRRRP